MKNVDTFVEVVKEQEEGSPFCPYAAREHHWFYISYSCFICGDWSKYKDIQGENPCSIEDFRTCLMFPHEEKK
jgi:hypothetical protein